MSCASATETYACIDGVWNVVACQGPEGCRDSTDGASCDLSVATAGSVCPPWAQADSACDPNPAAIVVCTDGKWRQSAVCTGGSCDASGSAPRCVTQGQGGGSGSTGGGSGQGSGGGSGSTGGGSGSLGGGAGTTGGGSGGSCSAATCAGCCAGGECISAPLNSSTNFCGVGGAACDDCGAKNQRCNGTTFACEVAVSCNASTCADGCCAAGQCVRAPLNASNNFCGVAGNACTDCARLGLRCEAATHTCELPNTGGGSGSGGGSGLGGGTGATGGGTGSTGGATGSTGGGTGSAGGGSASGGGGGRTGGGAGSTGGGAGASGGGAGATGGGSASDPCQGVPVGGQCLTSSLVRYCAVPTGSGTPSVQTYQCPGGSTCQASGSGAACVRSGSCITEDSRCASATSLQVCGSTGQWGPAQSCGTGVCVDTAVGGSCAEQANTKTITGTLRYQTRAARSDYRDWDTPMPATARNVLVYSTKPGAGGQNVLIDATTTDLNGAFSIKVQNTPGASDAIIFNAYGGDRLGVRYAVSDPGLSTGTFSAGDVGQSPRFWGWSYASSQFVSGSTVTITTAQGSAALNAFDLLDSIWRTSVTNNQGLQGLTVAVWIGIGTKWDCGACFSGDDQFQTGVWISGDAANEPYWSDYTISHELGHWQMASYGTNPNEGGVHFIMCPTFPGQAWSEGYATWHSAAVRNQPLLEDKQFGSFFWFNLDSRTYYPQSTSPSSIMGPGGTDLNAQIDENAVSTMLWAMSKSRPTGVQELFNAIHGSHLNNAPWPRGYTRRTWQVGNNCSKTNVVNTGQASLHLADMMDALSCGGSPAQSNRLPQSTILAACSTLPSTTNGANYPFPTTAPLCRTNFCYGCRSGSTCIAGTSTSACGVAGVACVQCATGQSCTNGVCQ